ncbi:Naaa [Symbiodinium sp. CCMP2456]|nr:Naaa [Symbiodinium sp. CCMP2456]
MRLLIAFAFISAACGGWIEDEALRLRTSGRVAAKPRRLTVNLDAEPKSRWSFLAKEPGFEDYRSKATGYLEKYIPASLLPIVNRIAESLESAYYEDYAHEMQGLAAALNLSVGEIAARRRGSAVQLNARDRGGSVIENLLEEILLGGKTPTHVMRKAMETAKDFDHFELFLLSERLANPAYFIVAGAQHGQGGILTRSRHGGHAWRLGEPQAMDPHGLNPQPDWFRLQTNYDPWTAVPAYDNRRQPAVANAADFCSKGVDEECMNKVMTAWPTKNHHTDITSVMCPRTGFMSTAVWQHAPAPETMVV